MNVKTFFFLLSLLSTIISKAQTPNWNQIISGPDVTLMHDTSGLLTIIGFNPGDSIVNEPVLLTKIYTKGTIAYKYNDELVIEYVNASFSLYDNGSYEALFFVPVPGSLNEYQFLTEKDILKFKQHDNTR